MILGLAIGIWIGISVLFFLANRTQIKEIKELNKKLTEKMEELKKLMKVRK